MSFGIETTGVYSIAVTPFDEQGNIDTYSTTSMIDFYRECGVSGLTILGILGESQKLNQSEAVTFALDVIKQSDKLPIIVGVSSPGFAQIRSLSHTVMDAGAAGVMIAPPPSLRTDDQIMTYFDQAVAAIGDDVPFVLQDHPLILSVQMSPSVIRNIVSKYSNCVMLKHEEWPGLEKITSLRGFEEEGKMRHISILCGNGGLFLDFELQRGANGAMTGYVFPEMLVELCTLAEKGSWDSAHELFNSHLPLIRYEQQTGIGLAVRKYILKKRGAIRCDRQRLPSSTLTAEAQKEVDYLVSRVVRNDRANVINKTYMVDWLASQT